MRSFVDLVTFIEHYSMNLYLKKTWLEKTKTLENWYYLILLLFYLPEQGLMMIYSFVGKPRYFMLHYRLIHILYTNALKKLLFKIIFFFVLSQFTSWTYEKCTLLINQNHHKMFRKDNSTLMLRIFHCI